MFVLEQQLVRRARLMSTEQHGPLQGTRPQGKHGVGFGTVRVREGKTRRDQRQRAEGVRVGVRDLVL